MALFDHGLVEKFNFLTENDQISVKMHKLEKICSDAKNDGKMDQHKSHKKSGLV